MAWLLASAPMWSQVLNTPDREPLLQWQGLRILPGLNAVTGDEGSGKTRLLQQLATAHADALWLDLRLPGHDAQTPPEVWQSLLPGCPAWNSAWCDALAQALGLSEHLGKRLNMLSTGSRRKVALVALLASGKPITCLDQPYASLDLHSVQVLREFLRDMHEHPGRAWLVADYEADPALDWASQIVLQTD